MGVLYGIYLDDGSTSARFPVNPIGELKIEHPTENELVNVLALGEIALGRKPNLRTVSFESFFPAVSGAPYTVQEYQSPEWWVSYIKAIQEKADEEPARLIIDRRSDDSGDVFFSDNLQVLVESFDILDKGGEPGDIYYSISFTEWKPHEAETVTLQIPASSAVSALTEVSGGGDSGGGSSGGGGDSGGYSGGGAALLSAVIGALGTGGSTPTVQAITEPQRSVPASVFAIGNEVTVNGAMYYTSLGDSPISSGNNLQATVVRIVADPETRHIAPIYVESVAAHYVTPGIKRVRVPEKSGWVKTNQLIRNGNGGAGRL